MSRWLARLPAPPLIGLALVLGVAITAGLMSLAVKGLIQDEEASFGIGVGAVKDNLVQRLTSVNEMLHGMRLLFDASKSVDADAFQIVGNDAPTHVHTPPEVPGLEQDIHDAIQQLSAS